MPNRQAAILVPFKHVGMFSNLDLDLLLCRRLVVTFENCLPVYSVSCALSEMAPSRLTRIDH